VEKGDRLMPYWLFKSEPDTWGWNDQVAKGDAGEEWHGVRNYQARNNMRAMKVGDLGFFYHSNIGKEVVGIVEVCRESQPDSTTDDPRWDCVHIRALRPAAASGDARHLQDRSAPVGHGAGEQLATLCAAGQRRGMASDLRAWRPVRLRRTAQRPPGCRRHLQTGHPGPKRAVLERAGPSEGTAPQRSATRRGEANGRQARNGTGRAVWAIGA
jgi:predicted RNA-binding protein with PUA-like domain